MGDVKILRKFDFMKEIGCERGDDRKEEKVARRRDTKTRLLSVTITINDSK
jgi:hypothetical protein